MQSPHEVLPEKQYQQRPSIERRLKNSFLTEKCLVYIELRRKEDLPDQHLWFALQQLDGNLSDQ